MKPNLMELQLQMRQRELQVRSSNHSRPKNCPVCAGTKLIPTRKEGIEIDCCPWCRGVWLDRPELDHLIELVSSGTTGLRIHRPPLPGELDGASGPEPHPLYNFTAHAGRKRSLLKDIFE